MTYTHSNTNKKIKRVIVLGSKGFVGSNISRLLKKNKVPLINIHRKNYNLEKEDEVKLLSKKIIKGDIVIFAAAKAPVKNNEMLFQNIKMCRNICKFIDYELLEKLIYISSDAVYEDSKSIINENSRTNPDSLHGIMHLTREKMLIESFKNKICIVRPTLIYGIGDPHNGYGPNQFNKLIKLRKDINLFGKGEELRDHIHIDDVSNIIFEVIIKRGVGIINLVSGKVISFNKIAKILVKNKASKSKIIYNKRTSPMPHDGFRKFSLRYLKKYFPQRIPKNFQKGVKSL
jgi:UDP-glucose 4-epimerase